MTIRASTVNKTAETAPKMYEIDGPKPDSVSVVESESRVSSMACAEARSGMRVYSAIEVENEGFRSKALGR
jgi:hypothetical protein